MSEPVHPLRRASDLKRMRRRASDNRRASDLPPEDRSLPVALEAEPAHSPPPPHHGPEATYAAHLLGQKEARRGLRGGAEVLDAARSAYLGAEFSGQTDRRPSKGLLRKTEI